MRTSDDFHHNQMISQYDAKRLGFIYGLAGSGQAQGGGGGGGGAPAPAAAAEAAPVVEKAQFDLKLESYDPAKKVHVIKEVRALTKLGLKEVLIAFSCFYIL